MIEKLGFLENFNVWIK